MNAPGERIVRVRLGRTLAGAAGRSHLSVRLASAATCRTLRARAAAVLPHGARALDGALVVAGGRVLNATDAVPEDDEITLLFPTAGG